MSDINVALSTTKHVVAMNQGSPDNLRKMNVPICTANMSLLMYGYGHEMEREEAYMAELSKSMAKTVYVNSEKMYVFIGEDPDIPDTALIEYTEINLHEYAHDFFKQWNILHILLFEFVLLDNSGKPRFTLKGLWDRDRWHSLEIKYNPSLSVIKKT